MIFLCRCHIFTVGFRIQAAFQVQSKDLIERFLFLRHFFHSGPESAVFLIDFINGLTGYFSDVRSIFNIFSISGCVIACMINRETSNREIEPASLKKWAEGSVDKSDICKYLSS